MKRCRTLILALAASLPSPYRDETPTSISLHAETALKSDISTTYIELYQNADARWLINRRHGVISVWNLKDAAPLWSNDGVVFRLTPSRNNVVSILSATDAAPSKSATEINGRVYFFLDDVRRRRVAEKATVRRNDLLVALDSRAQGRLVWTRRAKDFAPFFTSDASSLRFDSPIAPIANDKLTIRVRNDQEVKEFAIDAADGSFH